MVDFGRGKIKFSDNKQTTIFNEFSELSHNISDIYCNGDNFVIFVQSDTI